MIWNIRLISSNSPPNTLYKWIFHLYLLRVNSSSIYVKSQTPSLTYITPQVDDITFCVVWYNKNNVFLKLFPECQLSGHENVIKRATRRKVSLRVIAHFLVVVYSNKVIPGFDIWHLIFANWIYGPFGFYQTIRLFWGLLWYFLWPVRQFSPGATLVSGTLTHSQFNLISSDSRFHFQAPSLNILKT